MKEKPKGVKNKKDNKGRTTVPDQVATSDDESTSVTAHNSERDAKETVNAEEDETEVIEPEVIETEDNESNVIESEVVVNAGSDDETETDDGIQGKVYKKMAKKNQIGIEKVVTTLCYHTRIQELKATEMKTQEKDERKKGKANRQNKIKKANKIVVTKNVLNEEEEEEEEDGNEPYDSSEDDPDDDEILEVIGHKKVKGGKGYKLTIVWDKAGEWISDSIEAVVDDGWNECLDYIRGVTSVNDKKDSHFIETMLKELKSKADTKQKKTAISAFEKESINICNQASKTNNKRKIVDTEKCATSGKMCNHTFSQMEEEINPAVCRGGNKLDGVNCARCSRKMVDKGKNRKDNNEHFKPGPSTPAFMCNNIEECEYAICGYCVGPAIEEEQTNNISTNKRRRA